MSAETGNVVTAEGKKLNKVEALKLAKDGLDVWDNIFQYAKADVAEPLEELLSPKDYELFQKTIPHAGKRGSYSQAPNAKPRFPRKISFVFDGSVFISICPIFATSCSVFVFPMDLSVACSFRKWRILWINTPTALPTLPPGSASNSTG